MPIGEAASPDYLEIASAFCCDRGMKRLFPVFCLFSCLIAAHSFAGSATWNLDPTSGDWNTADNWTPASVPNGPDNVATFGVSNQTDVTISKATILSELIFNPGASAYTITNEKSFTISGAGITNNSGIVQNFVATVSLNDLILQGQATAGNMTLFTVTNGYPFGGFMIFFSQANAANGTFLIEGNDTEFGSGGALIFDDDSSAGNGNFTVNGGSFEGAEAGNISFQGGSAGDGVFVINGATASGALGGEVLFSGGTAGNATLIANPGTNGGYGGEIRYAFTSVRDESEARLELFGNGTLDMTYIGATVGSIEGDGVVMLGGNLLITGANNLSTTFSGTINGGSLQKIGTGSLTLTGANTYTDGTTIEGGKLVANNRDGSCTGTGPVQVNAGRLGGRGIIAGDVIIGIASGPDAILAPGQHKGRQNTLAIQGALTFNWTGLYECGVNTKSALADKVVANGVTINGGRLLLRDPRGFALNPGTVLTVIDNTSAVPISGTFANLADGAIVTVGSNTYQANYEGGGGNDLTLTVVP